MRCIRVGVFLAAGVGLSTSVRADVRGDYWSKTKDGGKNQRGMFWTHQAAVDFSVRCWISRFCFNFRPGCSQITWCYPVPLCASMARVREALECGKMVWTGTACPGRSVFGCGESSGCRVREAGEGLFHFHLNNEHWIIFSAQGGGKNPDGCVLTGRFYCS